MKNIDTLDLNLVAKRYGSDYVDDISFVRSIAFEIDKDPLLIRNYKNSSIIERLCRKEEVDCILQTKQAEALAYGDANVFLSCPGASLAGGAMREMADKERLNYFFDFVEKEKCTTFAGITEPDHGSDVASIETKLEMIDESTYQITGKKCFITHGADAPIGVVVARTSSGPFGITGVMVTPKEFALGEKERTINREILPVVGMRGTCLARINFDQFKVPAENILGKHLRLIGRGMMAVMKTFNLMRPCVSGFVLGQGQGIVDYVSHCLKPLPSHLRSVLAKLNADLANARDNLYKAAEHIQKNPLDASQVSLAKVQITNLIERIFSILSDEFDATIFCEHPFLLKWFRDIYGFEYMEGTTNMQKRNVYQKHLKIRQ